MLDENCYARKTPAAVDKILNRKIKMILLGKRPRLPIKRTTSMTGITVDLSNTENPEAADNYQNPFRDYQTHAMVTEIEEHNNDIDGGFDQYFTSNNILAAMVSPRNLRRSSFDHAREPAHFLKTCGLCKRRLSAGRDIYMYRGDTAFCSQECREEQIKQDDKKDNCSVPSSNNDDRRTSET